MNLTSRLMTAAREGGLAGLLASVLPDIVELTRMQMSGNPYPRILHKTFTGAVTLSATSGQTSDFRSSDFKNDGKYAWCMTEVFPITTTGSSAWRLALKDVETSEVFFGSPGRVLVTQIIDSNQRPTGLGRIRHTVSPNGGITPIAESVGSADVVEVTLKGFWIVEDMES